MCPKSLYKAVSSFLSKNWSSGVDTLSRYIKSLNAIRDDHWIYELIRNADESQYSRARGEGRKPSLTLILRSDMLIIHSNEDGLTDQDVEAICSLNGSRKFNRPVSRETGLGFKSVFKVAGKVNIQSGPFSFSLHKDCYEDTDGPGMIIPTDEPVEILPESVRTRIMLSFSHVYDSDLSVKVLTELQDGFFAFLENLQSVKVKFLDGDEPTPDIQYSVEKDLTTGLRKIVKRRTSGTQTWIESTTFYHIFSRSMEDLLYNGKSLEPDPVTVVLAFPMEESRVPILEDQYAFSPGPLETSGLKFLINSDFVVQSETNAIKQCPRNDAVLLEVAYAFRDSIPTFPDESLRPQWTAYLPTTLLPRPLWESFRPKIKEVLYKSKVLRGSFLSEWCTPRQLRWVGPEFRDHHGRPLFADILTERLYVQYNSIWDVEDTRKAIGLESLTWDQFLDRMEADLERGGFSQMKSSFTDNDWHTRVATALAKRVLDEAGNIGGSVKPPRRMDSMPLVPLINGSWASPMQCRTSEVFFSSCVAAQDDPNTNSVHPNATSNLTRNILFLLLGVNGALCVQSLMSQLFEFYRSSEVSTLEESIVHLIQLIQALDDSRAEKDFQKALELYKILSNVLRDDQEALELR
ncbi:hypothetical protein SLS56_009411 [Neofusicoccum ribis]|uniref:Uncharacterized protein n=1 Tax=Neofusicoccum ribis TaxID=45134 RepID=A0ABR3SH96_9PEZI